MNDSKQHNDVRDDLSDAASSLADERTLNEEPLPSYHQVSDDPIQRPPEKVSTPLQHSQSPAQTNIPQGPTIADPFAFPSQEPPSYPAADAIQRPLAIPQIAPSAAAPFLLAYPTALLGFGITTESWYSFMETLSAFLSANVSQQAVHHAADIGSNIGDFHKKYAVRTKQGFKNIGKSAKKFNPLGMVGQAIGITMGSVGHVVGAVFHTAGSLTRKPQTPRERATVYVETANKNWFHSRGLHAILMDTSELSNLCEVHPQEILSAAHNCGSAKPDLQLAGLRDIIGDVNVDESRTLTKISSSTSSKAAGKRPLGTQLQLGGTTLWLVVVQTQEMTVLLEGSQGKKIVIESYAA